MAERRPSPAPGERFPQAVGRQEQRKLWARRNARHDVWFGFGLFGMVGWSIATPTLLGAALGLWLDRSYPGGRSWTLALLVAGLACGCAIAWHWVARELAAIERNRSRDDE